MMSSWSDDEYDYKYEYDGISYLSVNKHLGLKICKFSLFIAVNSSF